MANAKFECLYGHIHNTVQGAVACETLAKTHPIVFAVKEAIKAERDDYCMFFPEFPEPDPEDKNLDMLRLHNAAYRDQKPPDWVEPYLFKWIEETRTLRTQVHKEFLVQSAGEIDAIRYYQLD